MFCTAARAWTIYSVPKTRHSSCTAFFLTPTANNITSGKMEIEIKPTSEHSKTPFFVNIKNISSKEVNLSTKGDMHILRSQSKNENLFKRLLWNSIEVLFWNQVWKIYKIYRLICASSWTPTDKYPPSNKNIEIDVLHDR